MLISNINHDRQQVEVRKNWLEDKPSLLSGEPDCPLQGDSAESPRWRLSMTRRWLWNLTALLSSASCPLLNPVTLDQTLVSLALKLENTILILDVCKYLKFIF